MTQAKCGEESPSQRVRIRVKRLFTPDFNLPATGCAGAAQIDLAAWVSDPNNKATAYTFYDVDPESNPGATPLGTASATKGVVNFGQYVLVNVSNGSQSYWVQSSVPNGCGGIASSTLNAPAQTASLNAIPNLTVNSGDPVNIAFSGQNTTHIIWLDHATFNNPNIGIMGSIGQGDLAFTASNSTGTTQTATIRVIPYNGNCAGSPIDFTITVNPGQGSRGSLANSLTVSAQAIHAQDVILAWQLIYDQDLLYFEVEKEDEQGNFIRIAKQAYTGNGSYSYIDRDGMKAASRYRIKLVHPDGRIVWSETIEIGTTSFTAKQFVVYPNPTAGQVQVKALFPVEEQITWQLSDILGRVLLRGEMNQQALQIDLASLPVGSYHLLMISHEGKTYLHKIEKR